MLSGDSDKYYEKENNSSLKTDIIYEEIKSVAKLVTGSSFMNSKTAKQSRRFFIYDKNKSKLHMTKTSNGSPNDDDAAVFNPFKNDDTKTSDLIKNWDTAVSKDYIMRFDAARQC